MRGVILEICFWFSPKRLSFRETKTLRLKTESKLEFMTSFVLPLQLRHVVFARASLVLHSQIQSEI